ncbi:MAG: hypothetical protein OJF60_001648 [Burkholderiaceae bacterium]|jgi:hypothetical protein|nr:MAG: hypothetical protein OJF60_001648 [Burkholderiaceae bacterium]
MNTMDLLDRALKEATLYEWHLRLGLAEQSLYSARRRGNLSPSIAGSLAEALGLNVEKWIVTAALEGERDSACRDRMRKRYGMP